MNADPNTDNTVAVPEASELFDAWPEAPDIVIYDNLDIPDYKPVTMHMASHEIRLDLTFYRPHSADYSFEWDWMLSYDGESEFIAMRKAGKELYLAVLKKIIQPIVANKNKVIRKVFEKINKVKNECVKKQWITFIHYVDKQNYSDSVYGQCVIHVLKFLDNPPKKMMNKEVETEIRISGLYIKVLSEKLSKPVPFRVWKKLELTHFSKTISFFEWDQQIDCSQWRCRTRCTQSVKCKYVRSWQAWKKSMILFTKKDTIVFFQFSTLDFFETGHRINPMKFWKKIWPNTCIACGKR